MVFLVRLFQVNQFDGIDYYPRTIPRAKLFADAHKLAPKLASPPTNAHQPLLFAGKA
jgi:hypothetical protein